MADSLVWELIKNNNCFLHKRAHAKRAGAVQLSCEPGNVLGVHSFKYSGVANSKAVDVRTSVDPETNGTVVSLVYKNAKESSKPKKSTSSSVLKVSKGPKKISAEIAGVCSATEGKSYYRADLTTAAKIKYAKIANGVRVKNGYIKKGTGARTGRKCLK